MMWRVAVKRLAALITRSAITRATPLVRATAPFTYMVSIIASILLVVTARTIIATVVRATIIARTGAIVIPTMA